MKKSPQMKFGIYAYSLRFDLRSYCYLREAYCFYALSSVPFTPLFDSLHTARFCFII